MSLYRLLCVLVSAALASGFSTPAFTSSLSVRSRVTGTRATVIPARSAMRMEVEAATEQEQEEDEEEFVDLNKSWYAKEGDHDVNWYIVDADGARLGRLASEIAKVLLGKNEPTYHPAVDSRNYVIVLNAEKVAVTGNKRKWKFYKRHSGRPGGMKLETFEELNARIPERIIEKAVRGMLPKNPHGRSLFTHLKVYAGSSHPHEAQTPTEIALPERATMPIAV